MECLPVTNIPEGPEWTYEIKLDGYRLEVVCRGGETTLYSRRQNVLNKKFHYIVTALQGLPDGTVLDGELVALGSDVPTSIFCKNSAPPNRTSSTMLSTSWFTKTAISPNSRSQNDAACCARFSNQGNTSAFQRCRIDPLRRC